MKDIKNKFSYLALIISFFPLCDFISILFAVIGLNRCKEYGSEKNSSIYALVISFTKIIVLIMVYGLVYYVENNMEETFYCDIDNRLKCEYINNKRVCHYSNILGVNRDISCPESISSDFVIKSANGEYRSDAGSFYYRYYVYESNSLCYGSSNLIELHFNNNIYKYIVNTDGDYDYYTGDEFITTEEGYIVLKFNHEFIKTETSISYCMNNEMNSSGIIKIDVNTGKEEYASLYMSSFIDY